MPGRNPRHSKAIHISTSRGRKFMFRDQFRGAGWLALAITSSVFATTASAQQTGPDAPEAKASGTALGDIVVTAQRREQRADDVGVTINVLSGDRSEEHQSELQSLMRISYAVLCLQ